MLMSAFLRWVAVAGVAALLVGCQQSRESQQSAEGPPGTTEAGQIAWVHDFEEGMAQAAEEGKPVMVDFYADWCTFCKKLDAEVFSRPDVAEASEDFVAIKVDTEKDRETASKYGVSGLPTVVVLEPDGTEIRRSRGAVSYTVMLDEMAAAKAASGGA
jgi:thiol:disulfide interchange protein DsbD